MISEARKLLLVLTSLSVAVVSGCGNRLRINDAGGLVPTGRLVWQPVGPLPVNAEVFQFSGVSLEADVSYAQGEAREGNGISADEAVVVGLNTIPAAGGFNARANVIDVKGTVRGGLEIANMFRLEPMAGFQVVNAHLAVSGSTGQFSQERTASGFLYGLRAGLQPHRWVEFYGRVMNGILGGSDLRVDSAYSFQAEAGVRLAPIDFVGMFAGYRWSQYEFQVDKEQTNLDIGLDGPVLGVELRF